MSRVSLAYQPRHPWRQHLGNHTCVITCAITRAITCANNLIVGLPLRIPGLPRGRVKGRIFVLRTPTSLAPSLTARAAPSLASSLAPCGIGDCGGCVKGRHLSRTPPQAPPRGRVKLKGRTFVPYVTVPPVSSSLASSLGSSPAPSRHHLCDQLDYRPAIVHRHCVTLAFTRVNTRFITCIITCSISSSRHRLFHRGRRC